LEKRIPARLSLPRGPIARAAIGLATTPLFMAVFYYLILGLAGFVRRLFGRNDLVRPAGKSVWVDRAPGQRRGDLTRQS
jgi:hypothetical protein